MPMRPTHADASLIDSLGGPAAVARMLALTGKRPARRVENWKRRGIPAAVRLLHLELFPVQSGDEQSAAAPCDDAMRDPPNEGHSALFRAIRVAGSKARFAAAIGVKPQAVSAYFKRGLSPERCPAAEAATGVTCEQLRPDLRWHRDADNRVIAYAVPLEPVETGKATALEPAA